MAVLFAAGRLIWANRGLGLAKTKIGLVIFLLGLAPAVRYFWDFRIGYMSKDAFSSFLFELAVCMLILPILAGIAIGVLVPIKRIVYRFGFGFGVFFLSGALALFAPPGGAISYIQGFAYRLHTEFKVGELEHQAQEILIQYGPGSLKPTLEPTYWDPGDACIATENLPPLFKTGIFQASGIENYGPEISLGKVGGALGPNQACLVIAWYDYGIIIGPADLTLQFNPWYLKSISPGVYVYHGNK